MYSSERPVPAAMNLDAFLLELKEKLIQCSSAICSIPQHIPHWASSCTHLLYSDKSIPPTPEFNEPGKLYISYKLEDPSAVMLVGTTKNKMPIKRKLKIKECASSFKITSEHVDFTTGKSFTCSGSGQTFQGALDQYFSTSKLDKQGSIHTEGEVQQEGDAFLWPTILHSKGHESWVEEIIRVVRKLFYLVPQEKHRALAAAIQNSIKDLNEFLKASENEKIVRYYDARLWLIFKSVCEHFNPLSEDNDHQRKELREHVIAENCRKLMKEEDIIPGLDSYFQALQMHQEIMESEQKEDPQAQTLISEYKKNRLYPEVEGHREQIKQYHRRCRGAEQEGKDLPSPKK
ncbi:MAG TPA: hypothetical protein VLH77_06735 [Gammaproteobacteria bacterium]|nr:hypothetical protein [Gammaproteobacteria bacterium]